MADPSTYPIEIPTVPLYRGDASGRNKVVITTIDDLGDPVDLTAFGTVWKSQAKDQQNQRVELTVDTSQASGGVLTISVPDNKSAGLTNKLDYDVQVSDGTISPLTLFKGKFTTSGEVTT